ncbi:hypothetical protein ACJJTC_000240 [Scirpophaga incertulas]
MWLLLPLLLCPAVALKIREPPAPSRLARNGSQELFFDVYLNQFMASDSKKFPMRFFYNEVNATYENIVINVGAEWSINPSHTEGGLPYEVADEVKGAVFYTEHRFFGKSRPTEDTSVENLQYLSVNHALRDLVQFINYIKSDEFQNGHYKYGKVVLIGCSLAGTMATWMRTAYPHLIDAAISDSGPVLVKVEFEEYLEVVTKALRTQGGEECVKSVEEGVAAVLAAAGTSAGRTQIQELFDTCTTLAEDRPLDLATFFWFSITETFAELVQYAKPGDIKDACLDLTNSTIGNPIQRFAAWISKNRDNKIDCLETRYSEKVASYKNTSYDARTNAYRLWTYMTCVEMGWFQTTASSVQPFGSTVPLDFFVEMCKDFFDSRFTETRVRHGVELLNTFYGGHDYLPDNVITVLGSLDPWAPMGPRPANATEKSPIFVIEGASHCNTFKTSSESDPEPLKVAKRAMMRRLRAIITGEEEPKDNAASKLHISVVLLLTVACILFE